METKTKINITCNCGEKFTEQTVTEEFSYPVMVCKGCGHKTFSVEQAKNYVHLERQHEKLQKQRKIIRIGNSLGITLPNAIDDFKEGTPVTLQRLGKKTFKLELG